MICEFSNPVNLNSTTTPDFEFQNLSCYSENATTIENLGTGAFFSFKNEINTGDAIIIFFLTIFLISYLFKIAYNFFWGK